MAYVRRPNHQHDRTTMNIHYCRIIVISMIILFFSSCALKSNKLLPVFKDKDDFETFLTEHMKEHLASFYVILSYYGFMTILSFDDTKSDSMRIEQWNLMGTPRGLNIHSVGVEYFASSLNCQEMISIINKANSEESCQPFTVITDNHIPLTFLIPNENTYLRYSVLLCKVLYDNCKELEKIFEIIEHYTLEQDSNIAHNQSDSLNNNWELGVFMTDTTFLILASNKILESVCNVCKKHIILKRLASEWNETIVDLHLTKRNDYLYLLAKIDETMLKCDTVSQNQVNIHEDLFNTFTDSRDGQSYETVRIGNQTWMAENLNFETANSWCYDNRRINCSLYGRLYDWQTARHACPEGWRLPTKSDFDTLIRNLRGNYRELYYDYILDECNASYGLYGGTINVYGEFTSEGRWGMWWSETDMNKYSKWSLSLNKESPKLDISGADIEKRSLSIRCIKE